MSTRAQIAILVAGLMILAGTVNMALRTIDGMIERAATGARAERDHYWRAEIERGNAIAQARIVENMKTTMAVQEAARDQVAAAEARASDLERQNAALPTSDRCGFGRDRVRLLNQR